MVQKNGHCPADGVCLIGLAACFCDAVSATERPNVLGSTECNAYCALFSTFTCGGGPEGWCEGGEACTMGMYRGTCAAAVKKLLTCEVATGTPACVNEHPAIVSNCVQDNSLCP